MVGPENFELLEQQKKLEQLVAERMVELVQAWDGPIREALNRLGQILWPTEYMWGIIPVSSYRLRDQSLEPAIHLWWVEHDIPPYDKYECAAYRVQLTVNEQLEPMVTVQSGEEIYPVEPLTAESLAATVAKVGNEVPLIIPRVMGTVRD